MPGHKNQIAIRSLRVAYHYGRASVWLDRSEAESSTDERMFQSYDENGGGREFLKASMRLPIRLQRYFPPDFPPAPPPHGAFFQPRHPFFCCSPTLPYPPSPAKGGR